MTIRRGEGLIRQRLPDQTVSPICLDRVFLQVSPKLANPFWTDTTGTGSRSRGGTQEMTGSLWRPRLVVDCPMSVFVHLHRLTASIPNPGQHCPALPCAPMPGFVLFDRVTELESYHKGESAPKKREDHPKFKQGCFCLEISATPAIKKLNRRSRKHTY